MASYTVKERTETFEKNFAQASAMRRDSATAYRIAVNAIVCASQALALYTAVNGEAGAWQYFRNLDNATALLQEIVAAQVQVQLDRVRELRSKDTSHS